MRKFWMVWGQGRPAPTYQHPTLESAKTEAERLTRAHGGKFHVLECVATAERDDVKWQTADQVLDSMEGIIHNYGSPTLTVDQCEKYRGENVGRISNHAFWDRK